MNKPFAASIAREIRAGSCGALFSKAPPCSDALRAHCGAMPSESVSSLLRLPKRKRLEIAESLWLSVADEEKMPVPASHRKILNARVADYQSGKSEPVSHEELMRRLRKE